jgi:hypothetical protein
MTDHLIWLFFGVVAGYAIGMITSYYHNQQLVHLAKMRIMAETGNDPMLVEALKKNTDAVPAPSKTDGIEELNKKIQQQYGEEFEVL